MKQSTIAPKIVVIVLFCAVLAYLGGAVWESFVNPFMTIYAYQHTVDDSVEATGWLVREEVVLEEGRGIVDIIPAQGERVASGQRVAALYSDASGLEQKAALLALEAERTQLEYSLRQDSNGSDIVALDQEIVQAIIQLKRDATQGAFDDVEENALSLKNMIFRRDYTYSGKDGAAVVETAVAENQREITNIVSAMSKVTDYIYAPQSGTFSGKVDGYEANLTPEKLTELTVGGYREMTTQPPADYGSAVGKLVEGATWYFTTTVEWEVAQSLTEGKSVGVAFTHDFTGDVTMTVEHISEPEDGMVAVVLSSRRYLAETSLLRQQTVELVFQRHQGIRVPALALRVETTVDEETGERQAKTGVYTLVGSVAEFKTVNILAEGQDFYLVEAVPRYAGDKQILRAGDEVIVAAEDIYDGKVVTK